MALTTAALTVPPMQSAAQPKLRLAKIWEHGTLRVGTAWVPQVISTRCQSKVRQPIQPRGTTVIGCARI